MSKSTKIKLHNFNKLSPNIDDRIKTAKWRCLEDALTAIFRSDQHQEINSNFEELFRIVNELFADNFQLLVQNLAVIVTRELQTKYDHLIQSDTYHVRTVNDLFQQFVRQVNTIRNIFIINNRLAKSVCYKTFADIFFKQSDITNNNRIIGETLDIVQTNRHHVLLLGGESDDLMLLKSMIKMFHDLDLEQGEFSTRFLDDTETFYRIEGNRLIEQLTTAKYLEHVRLRIDQEAYRIQYYFCTNLSNQVSQIINRHLIVDHLNEILDGLNELIENNNLYELRVLYELLRHNSRILYDYVLARFKMLIGKRGAAITETINDKNMIQDLLDYKDHLDAIVAMSFYNDRVFIETIRSGFKLFLSKCNMKAAQLLVKYIDNKLRSKALCQDKLEIISIKVIELFRFIQNKDIFEAFYKKYLAKRLLHDRSTSQDAENFILTKLKYECGTEFTSNMEGMFLDINISKLVNLSFKKMFNNDVGDVNVFVLTKSNWPTYQICNVKLPSEFIKGQSLFHKFYLENYSGRKLIWQANLGHCIVRSHFDSGLKELQISLLQTLVLLLFNQDTRYTVKDIQLATNICLPDLKRTLLSLSCGKNHHSPSQLGVLIKTTSFNNKDIIHEDDVFAYNNNFTSKLYRVKINELHESVVDDDDKETEKNVLFHRQYQIDAAIVAIMKRKHSVSHNELLSELFEVLNVPVKPSDLKKRIELLIERDYMQRDVNDRTNYTYIA